MKRKSFSKFLVIGIVVLFVGASVVPSISGNDRNIIYVADDGGADYTSFQDAIDNVTLMVMDDNDFTDITLEEICVTEGITIVFEEDFESGWDGWWVDNGVWEVGVPTVGPDSAHSGQNCSGTILGGNYPSDANTRLISPEITLPSLLPGERLSLKFWHWFRTEDNDDTGHIQISVNGGDWQTIAGPFSGISPIWSQVYVDLSAYANATVRIAFCFTSDWAWEDNGWYVDDVEITGLNLPPTAPSIDGPTSGKVGIEYNYKFITTDPNGDNVYYYIDWGDENVEDWIGPYSSGEEVTKGHTWSKKGTYIIKAKAKDVYGAESDWGTLVVTMPKNQVSNKQQSTNSLPLRFLERFMDQYPQAFPLLRNMLGR